VARSAPWKAAQSSNNPRKTLMALQREIVYCTPWMGQGADPLFCAKPYLCLLVGTLWPEFLFLPKRAN